MMIRFDILKILAICLLFPTSLAAQESLLPPVEAKANGKVAEESLATQNYAHGDQIIGDPNAPVEIIEYASLTCPHCARFHKEVLPKLKEKYIDTGKVKLIFREVYFDRLGLWAAMLSRCAGSDAYFSLVDTLFRSQPEWAITGDMAVAELRKTVKLAGLSDAQMDQCFRSEAMAKQLIANYETATSRDNVRATPTIFINGNRIHNAFDIDILKLEIESGL